MGEALQNILFYILIFGGLIFALKSEGKKLGANVEGFRKGRGKEGEPTNILLDRLEWVSDYKTRICPISQVYIISILVSIVLGMAMINKFPSGTRLFQMMLVIFPLLLFGLNFFNYHMDRFVPYYIKKDVEYIRKNLNLKRKKDLEDLTVNDNIPKHSDLNELRTL